MTYNKGYYEQNKERISNYNKTRRLENPEVVEKERKAYQLKVDDFKIRSTVYFRWNIKETRSRNKIVWQRYILLVMLS